MLAVFACGALADLTLPPDNVEAPAYHLLSKAALSQQNLFGAASLSTVQALSMLGAYDLYLCTRNSLEFSWKMLSFAMILGSSVRATISGMTVVLIDVRSPADWFTSVTISPDTMKNAHRTPDRDPERWKLDPKIIDRRRSVFWELFHVDKWKVYIFMIFPLQVTSAHSHMHVVSWLRSTIHLPLG